jgi:hypothetical protein
MTYVLSIRLQESTISNACETTSDRGDPTSLPNDCAWLASENFLQKIKCEHYKLNI